MSNLIWWECEDCKHRMLAPRENAREHQGAPMCPKCGDAEAVGDPPRYTQCSGRMVEDEIAD